MSLVKLRTVYFQRPHRHNRTSHFQRRKSRRQQSPLRCLEAKLSRYLRLHQLQSILQLHLLL